MLFYRWAKRTVSQELLQELLPGPVTVVFERTEQLNPQLNPGNSLVGIRIPDYPFMRQLVAQCSHPLALTSANISNTRSSLAIEVRWIELHIADRNYRRLGFDYVVKPLSGLMHFRIM